MNPWLICAVVYVAGGLVLTIKADRMEHDLIDALKTLGTLFLGAALWLPIVFYVLVICPEVKWRNPGWWVVHLWHRWQMRGAYWATGYREDPGSWAWLFDPDGRRTVLSQAEVKELDRMQFGADGIRSEKTQAALKKLWVDHHDYFAT